MRRKARLGWGRRLRGVVPKWGMGSVDVAKCSFAGAGLGCAPVLSVLHGQDGNGTWTLFVADFSPGGLATLNSWTLEVSPVPAAGADRVRYMDSRVRPFVSLTARSTNQNDRTANAA